MFRKLEEIKTESKKHKAYEYLKSLSKRQRKRFINDTFYFYHNKERIPLLKDEIKECDKKVKLINRSCNSYLLEMGEWSVEISTNTTDHIMKRTGSKSIYIGLCGDADFAWIDEELKTIKNRSRKSQPRRELSLLYNRICMFKGLEPDITYPKGSITDYEILINYTKRLQDADITMDLNKLM